MKTFLFKVKIVINNFKDFTNIKNFRNFNNFKSIKHFKNVKNFKDLKNVQSISTGKWIEWNLRIGFSVATQQRRPETFFLRMFPRRTSRRHRRRDNGRDLSRRSGNCRPPSSRKAGCRRRFCRRPSTGSPRSWGRSLRRRRRRTPWWCTTKKTRRRVSEKLTENWATNETSCSSWFRTSLWPTTWGRGATRWRGRCVGSFTAIAPNFLFWVGQTLSKEISTWWTTVTTSWRKLGVRRIGWWPDLWLPAESSTSRGPTSI